MSNLFTPAKQVEFEVEEGENAFQIMAGWRKQAMRARWSKDDISKVLDAAKSGDYDNLLRVINDHSF